MKASMRSGTKQGSDHIRLGYSNQDAKVEQSFYIPSLNQNYWVGLVSDGCSGNSMFSHTEVGAHLITLYALNRVQEFIRAGMNLEDIPQALFAAITEFLRDLLSKVMPETVIWSYPAKIKDRENWSSQRRFRNDYLAATLLGFVVNENQVLVFSAGDGIILINGEISIIDQNDTPAYPVLSINQAKAGFVTMVFKTQDINRIAVMTDGLKHLVGDPEFVEQMFSRKPQALGLQFLLNTINMPHLMKDDCTAVVWEKST